MPARSNGQCRMIYWFCLGSIASAASNAPSLDAVDVLVDWRAETAHVRFLVPTGQHVAPDAPLGANLEVGGSAWMLHTIGATVHDGLPIPIPATRPVLLDGVFTLSVCDDEGTTCRVVERSVRGALDAPRGRDLRLEAVGATATEQRSAGDFDGVLAAAGDQLVLLEFGAVWCPPCNLLSAELTHDPSDAALFEDILLFEVDADDHASWSIKDRYAVGGYPTLIAVDGTGAEVARLVGYPGEAATKRWLAELETTVPLSSPPEPSALTPEEAGAWARRFVEGQRDARAAPYLSRAAESDVAVLDAQVARYLLEPTVELAHQLADAGVPVEIWGWSAMGFSIRDPTLTDRVRVAARDALREAAPHQAGDLFCMLAELSPEAARPDLYRAGAIAVAAGLTGELEQDRGHIGWLSRLWEYAGEPEQAAAVLAPALERWPDDMTFHEDRAALALRTGDVETAMHEGRFAVELGLGDNRLRVLATYARALDAAGRTEEARQLVSDVLANTPPPPEALNVRTPRYLKALAELPFMVASPTEP